MNVDGTSQRTQPTKIPRWIAALDLEAAYEGKRLLNIPYVGKITPTGWQRVCVVDWIGLGVRGIMASHGDSMGYFVVAAQEVLSDPRILTQDRFLRQIKAGYGYGVIGKLPTMIHVGVFSHILPEVRKNRMRLPEIRLS